MQSGTNRILTTHVGSLPRPEDLVDLIDNKERRALDAGVDFDGRVRRAVLDVVQQQVETGIDIVSDGEQGKPGYVTYIKDRLNGFGGEHRRPVRATGDERDFPEFVASRAGRGSTILYRPACDGLISWRDFGAVSRDIENFRAAQERSNPFSAFMTAPSPGVVPLFLGNDHYEDEDAFKVALAEVLQDEYEAIVDAGFILQIDCPDLAMGRHFVELSTEEFRRLAARNIELLNEATRNIPPERMRMHLCWGNSEGPHHLDIPLIDIIDIVLTARPSAISFEAANPRHAHEWEIWSDLRLPEGKVLIPGVIDSTTNYIEHPLLVAQRLRNYASVVGAENIIAGTDCGFGTWAGSNLVDSRIAWAKMQSLVEGARLASTALSS